MKRFTAILLALIMAFSLCACGVNTDKNGDSQKFTEPTEVTAPDGRPVYSDEPMIEYPQTGAYKETALLTNVPGQGVPLLLDMREDGTIDYIFGSTDDYSFANRNNRSGPSLLFKDNGVKYYSIAPDGTATLHNEKWIEEIDNYVKKTTAAANIKNGKWIFHFAAEDGTILILGQFGPNLYTISEMLVTVLFKIQNDQVTIVPIDYHVDFNGEPANWSAVYMYDLRLENGYVFFESGNTYIPNVGVLADTERAYAAYHLNGTLSDMKAHDDIGKLGDSWAGYDTTSTVISVNTDGKICLDEVYWSAPFQYTEDDRLYNLGKYDTGRKHRSNISLTTYENPGEDFCCFFNEAGQGVLIRYDYNPDGKIDPDILTVWSLEHNETIAAAVAQWNHTHASPIFRYETVQTQLEGTNLTEEDILTRLNLELLNGQGPDVMVLDGLNVEKYMEFMVPLDRLNTEGVYQSIIERFTVNGELLALPMRMVPYLIGRLEEGTQKIESLEQFADMVTTSGDVIDVRDIEDWQPHPGAQYHIRNYNQLFWLWYPAWADAIWEDGKLNKDVFVEFLTQTLRLVDHYTLTQPVEQWGINKPSHSETLDTAYTPFLITTDFFYKQLQSPYTLVAPGYVGIDTYWYSDSGLRTPDPVYPHYIEHIPGPDGSGVMVPTAIAGVRAGGHEEEGLEFVQSLLSRELQLAGNYWRIHDGDGYPVIWEHAETLIRQKEKHNNQECAVQNSYEETITNLRTVIIDEYLFEQSLFAAQSCYRTENRLTPEEAAEALAEATRIYLAELR